MDLEELTAALSEHTPDPESVLARFHEKQRRRAKRRTLAASCAASAAVIAALAAFLPRMGEMPSYSVVPAAGSAATASSGIQAAHAGSCAPVPLRTALADARTGGASVIVADGTLTGHTTDGLVAVVLRDVRTLHGPRIASGATGWVRPGALPGGPGTRLFAIVWPSASRAPGRLLSAAPVAGGQVMFSPSGCWRSADLALADVERLVTGG
ncbi:MAG TPA: hypothetical protein VF070_39350 [Streptosporangiaceae bacterium]